MFRFSLTLTKCASFRGSLLGSGDFQASHWAGPIRCLAEFCLNMSWHYADADSMPRLSVYISLHHHSWWAYHPRDYHIYRFLLTLNQVYESLLAPFGLVILVDSTEFHPQSSCRQAPRPLPPWNWPQSRSVLLPDQLSLLASLVTHDQNAIECRCILYIYITNKKTFKKKSKIIVITLITLAVTLDIEKKQSLGMWWEN